MSVWAERYTQHHVIVLHGMQQATLHPIPEPDNRIMACRGELGAFRTTRRGGHYRVVFELLHNSSLSRIPQTRRPRFIDGQDEFLIRAEASLAHGFFVRKTANHLTCCSIPQSGGLIVTSSEYESTVSTETGAVDLMPVLKSALIRSFEVRHRPDAHSPIVASRDDAGAIGANCYGPNGIRMSEGCKRLSSLIPNSHKLIVASRHDPPPVL
jgi:hypothetical protein